MTWADATPDQIVADIADALAAGLTESQQPGTILFAERSLRRLARSVMRKRQYRRWLGRRKAELRRWRP